jgi:large subunit ribosomal protein L15e
MKKSFQNEYKERADVYKSKIIKWNTESSVVRVEGPTNIARARELGYKAKEGVIIARVKVSGGTRKRKHNAGGRKPKKSGRYFTQVKSLQAIAEERAARKFGNFTVLNSYFIGASGSRKFYEVILLDPSNNGIKADRQYENLLSQTGRVYRGLTSVGRRHRGISKKRFGAHKLR